MARTPRIDRPNFRENMETEASRREELSRRLAKTAFSLQSSEHRASTALDELNRPLQEREARVRRLAQSVSERALEMGIPFNRFWVVSTTPEPGAHGRPTVEGWKVKKMRRELGGTIMLRGWLLNEPVVAHGETVDHTKIRAEADHILLPYSAAHPDHLLAFNSPNTEKSRFASSGHGHHGTPTHDHYDPELIPVYSQYPEETVANSIRIPGVKAPEETWNKMEQGLAHFARTHNLATPLGIAPLPNVYEMPPIEPK